MDISVGEPNVLIGPVAAGKSSLLRGLTGLLDAGEATVGGERMLFGKAISATNHGALVGQRAATLIGTVRECLGIPERAAAIETLEAYGLTSIIDDLDAPLLTLSSVDARLVLLARFAAAGAPLIAIDEPTVGLGHSEVFRYCSVVKRIASELPVVVATHPQLTARELGGTISLLAAGIVVEAGPTRDFFASPKSETAKQYVRTGSCPSPSPDTDLSNVDPSLRDRFPELFPGTSVRIFSTSPRAEARTPAVPLDARNLATSLPSRPPAAFATWTDLDSDTPADGVRAAVRESPPRGLSQRLSPIWIHTFESPNGVARFGGCRRPGLLADLDDDLNDLRGAGVDVLISLEAEHRLDSTHVRRHGIAHYQAPFTDMRAPAAHDMIDLCLELDRLFAEGSSVCVHCRAGLGRTGTVLAGYLIWTGLTAKEAIQKVRLRENKFVSTEAQERFLVALAEAMDQAR